MRICMIDPQISLCQGMQTNGSSKAVQKSKGSSNGKQLEKILVIIT